MWIVRSEPSAPLLSAVAHHHERGFFIHASTLEIRTRLIHDFRFWWRWVAERKRSIKRPTQTLALPYKCTRPRKAVAELLLPNRMGMKIG
jgi:hypothetical protein